jgi:hypothetical protein
MQLINYFKILYSNLFNLADNSSRMDLINLKKVFLTMKFYCLILVKITAFMKFNECFLGILD